MWNFTGKAFTSRGIRASDVYASNRVVSLSSICVDGCCHFINRKGYLMIDDSDISISYVVFCIALIILVAWVVV